MLPAGPQQRPPESPDSEGWTAQRRAPRHTDEALTGTTRAWLRKLPSGRQPQRLCVLYPRVANRIAWCWNDATLLPQVLDDLLVDRRGGRKGFPRSVVVELKRLRDYADNPRLETRAGGSWASLRGLWPRD